MFEEATREIERLARQIAKEEIEKALKGYGKSGNILATSGIEWAKAKVLARRYGVSKATVYNDLKDMAKSTRWSKYIRQSSRSKEVNVEGYNSYRQAKSDEYLL